MLRGRSTTESLFLEPLMTSSDQTSAPETVVDDAATDEKTPIPAFSFPFKPADFAQTKNDQPWYQQSNKSGHHKTPGVAPHGTRKTMGKR